MIKHSVPALLGVCLALIVMAVYTALTASPDLVIMPVLVP